MKWINKNRNIVNIVLVSLITIYILFFDSVGINIDYFLIGVFFIFNTKIIIEFFKKNKIIFILMSMFMILNLVQVFVLSDINGISDFIYNCRFLILTLFPIMLLITIDNLMIKEKEINAIKLVFIISLIALMIYGFITYIFNIDLFKAGMYVLDGDYGRITSLFKNPNGYALFLLFCFIYFLFNNKMNKYFKWSMIALIISSICLSYGRVVYLLMGTVIVIYIIYNIFNKDKTNRLLNISIIVLMTYFSLYLPNNNYFFLSLTVQFDGMFNTSISVPTYKIIDAIVLRDYETNSEQLYIRILNSEDNELSSSSTRSLFKKYALEIYNENKLFGVSYNNYFKELDIKLDENNIDYVDANLPHNFYVLLLSSTGIIGTLIYIFILIFTGIYIINFKKDKNYLALFIFIIYLISNYQGDYALGTYYVYIVIALAMKKGYNIYRNKRKEVVL